MVLGTGRGGTTLFLEMLGEHPDLAWFSNFTHRAKKELFYPLAALSRIREIPWLGDVLPYNWKIRPKPREANDLYAVLSHGVFNQPRTLKAEDADERQIKYWRKAVRAHLRWQGKPRFLNKHTGFPRTDYLRQIFSDGHFIHVIRDGRAVANSYVNVPFWDGTLEGCWHWGEIPGDFRTEFENSGREPVVLAGILWKFLMAKILESWQRIPSSQKMEVNYSEFVKNPSETMEQVLQFGGLSDSTKFQNRIAKIKVHNADMKWEQDLDSRQKDLLMQTIGKELESYGFLK